MTANRGGQIVAALDPNLMVGLVRAINAAAASELGLDASRALGLSFKHYSEHNPFLVLANDARAIALHLASTGYNIQVSELAAALQTSKQIISRQVHRGEDLRDKPAQRQVITRLEDMLGING